MTSAVHALVETPWRWSPVMAALALSLPLLHVLAFGRAGGGRRWFIVGAAAIIIAATCSPLAVLADGQLFVAHMVQHLLLLLIVPLAAIASLPPEATTTAFRRPGLDRLGRLLAIAPLGWLAGVGTMWLWHDPAACAAAVRTPAVGVLRDAMFLAAGTAFWWPVAAPVARLRVAPPLGMAYLLSACIACTVLGAGVTFASTLVCPAFGGPPTPAVEALRRQGFTPQVDQQLGGLLMWLAPCVLYMLVSLLLLRRWHAAPAPLPAAASGAAAAKESVS